MALFEVDTVGCADLVKKPEERIHISKTLPKVNKTENVTAVNSCDTNTSDEDECPTTETGFWSKCFLTMRVILYLLLQYYFIDIKLTHDDIDQMIRTTEANRSRKPKTRKEIEMEQIEIEIKRIFHSNKQGNCGKRRYSAEIDSLSSNLNDERVKSELQQLKTRNVESEKILPQLSKRKQRESNQVCFFLLTNFIPLMFYDEIFDSRSLSKSSSIVSYLHCSRNSHPRLETRCSFFALISFHS